MHVIVSGCGRVGSQLSEFLSYEGHDVIVIDRDARSFRRLGATFNGITLEGVAFDEELLLEAGIDKADAFAAVTNFDNTNLMTAEIAARIYKVPHVISRLYYPERELTFFKMGIDYVCSTTMMADRIKERLFKGEDVIVQQERLDLGLQLVEFVITDDAHGIPAGDLNHGISSRLIVLVRGGEEMPWDEETPLRVGDHALITVRKEGWKALASRLGDRILENSGYCRIPSPVSTNAGTIAAGEQEPANVIIGGCSAVGAHLGYLLSMEGHDVTIIDEDPSLFERLPDNFKGGFVRGVTYDEETLLEAGVEKADYFTAVTKQDNKNLMACEVARHVFGVRRVVARLFNPDKEQTYQELGINYLCGTRMLARVFLERILQPVMRTIAPCFNNMLDVIEFVCPDSWYGKTVDFAKEKSGISFAYVARRGSGYMPEGNFVLKDGDVITAIGAGRSLQKLESYLRRHTGG